MGEIFGRAPDEPKDKRELVGHQASDEVSQPLLFFFISIEVCLTSLVQ